MQNSKSFPVSPRDYVNGVVIMLVFSLIAAFLYAYYNKVQPKQVSTLSNQDSTRIANQVVAICDSTNSVAMHRVLAASVENEELVSLLGKYEYALEQLRTHDREAYKYFIRIAQFKEHYNGQVEFDFYDENSKLLSKSKEQSW